MFRVSPVEAKAILDDGKLSDGYGRCGEEPEVEIDFNLEFRYRGEATSMFDEKNDDDSD